MLTLYQKYHTYLNLLLLTLLGLACGFLSTALLETFIDPPPSSSTATVATTQEETTKISSSDLNVILQNNIFDPASRSASVTMTPAEPGNETTSENESTPAQRINKNMTLLGTVVADEDSLALIEINKELAVYHLDDELPGGGTLEEIERNIIRVRFQDGTLVAFEINEEDEGRGNRTAAASPGLAGNSNGSSPGEEIRQIEEGHWVVPRSTAEKTRANLSTELRLAQMQPRIVDGKTDGFMIRRIRRSSILNKLGLQRGDVVLSVNNMSLNSPEAALQIFQQLREARQISVGVERKGEPMTFNYELD